ncbi:hypothetical protein [Parvularcula maris]|uniref:Uncharacterized protein n=1 Tax=Parvularcula maris TaxID=2965077 RepID=A0A9X2L8Q9_9PROT|nr:hypothetical protein [Parvularcula maris]MCQ8185165.1 hypothetical protein [Parvularcula maris]
MKLWANIQELILGRYERSKDEASVRIAGRLARGNISTQNGFIMDDEAFDRLCRHGDKAIKRLNRHISHAE